MRSICLAVLMLGGAVAVGDEIKLKNGDRVTGTVTGLAGGKLAVDTPHSGAIKIDWAQVASLTTEGKHKVRLVTGETIEGKLSGQDGKLKVASEGAAAPVEVDWAKVAFLNKPPTTWHGSVGLSARSTDGNTHTGSALATADLALVREMDEFVIRAIYRYGERSGELQERNTYGLGKYSYRLYERLYAFVSAEFLSDEFKDLKLQTVLAVGLGYEVLKESWADLSVEAGVAYIDNNFDEIQEDEGHAGARVSAKARLDLVLGFVAKDIFTIYPNFEESQDFQIRNELLLTNTLGGGWSVIGGVITEYDREPALGKSRHDDTYFLGLGYTF
jgi:putative salt-induced outer membrane protein YdiY